MDSKKKKRIFAFPYKYKAAQEVLEGEVLYWFLAGEVVRGFQSKDQDAFDAALALHADFLRDNPYEEFTEVVSRAKKKIAGVQTGKSCARVRSGRCGRPSAVLERSQGQGRLPRFLGHLVFALYREHPLHLRGSRLRPRTSTWSL